MIRYFRSTPAVYAAICAQLDAAYGYPNAETKTLRTLPLAAVLPRDSEGRVYLAIAAAYCDYVLPSQMLPQLVATGLVEEITAEQFHAVTPPSFQTAPASAFPGGTTTINGTLGGRTFGL